MDIHEQRNRHYSRPFALSRVTTADSPRRSRSRSASLSCRSISRSSSSCWSAIPRQLAVQVRVVVPGGVEETDEPHTPLDQAAREQAIGGKRAVLPRSTAALWAGE